MKFVKFLSAILAVITVMAMFAACTPTDTPEESLPEEPEEIETDPLYKVTAHFKVLDHNGKEVYSTDEDEPYEYESPYYAPTVLLFIEDYAFMNYKKFEYKANKNNGIDSVTIISKKKETTYKAGETVVSKLDGSEQKTFWICLINGKEVESMAEDLVKDGDTVVLRLAYLGSDKVTETERPEYTEPLVTEPTEESTEA